jgi:hypothetical protein
MRATSAGADSAVRGEEDDKSGLARVFKWPITPLNKNSPPIAQRGPSFSVIAAKHKVVYRFSPLARVAFQRFNEAGVPHMRRRNR